MKLLITGAEGLLGSQLAALASRDGYIVAAPEEKDLDITDENIVKKWINETRPDLIVNCAVLGPVESQKDPERAEEVNVKGVQNLQNNKDAARIIHFSSPAVFDGFPPLDCPEYLMSTSFGYSENHQRKSQSAYGKTKIESEDILAGTNALIVRTSWLFTDELPFGAIKMSRYPTNEIARPTACTFLWEKLKILIDQKVTGIVHICGPEIISRYEQAKRLGVSEAEACQPKTASVRPLSTSRIMSL